MCCELTKKLDLAFFEVCNIELVHVSLSHPGQIVYGKPRLLLRGESCSPSKLVQPYVLPYQIYQCVVTTSKMIFSIINFLAKSKKVAAYSITSFTHTNLAGLV